mgnify:CR=1 FL=1
MKLRSLLLAMLLLGALCPQVDAKLCIGCNAELPDNATFCAGCMTPQPKVAQLNAPAAKQINQREQVMQLFSFIDEYEGYFHDMKYLNVLGKMPEVKTKFANAAGIYRQLEPGLPEELKILAQIYAAKYQLFEGMTGIMKNLRIDSGFKAAIIKSSMLVMALYNQHARLDDSRFETAVIKSSMLVMALYNQVIDLFRADRHFGPPELDQLKAQVANIPKRTQKYNVTAKYLKLGDSKVPTGQQVMVLEVIGKRAHVMLMGPSMDNNPVEGPVSLRDLEKRTSWKKENINFYARENL